MTARKLETRLQLIAGLQHRRKAVLEPFKFRALRDASENPDLHTDPSTWETVGPDTYWGGPDVNFVMTSSFSVPAEWDAALPVALFLPLGEAGDFSHPEALAYIDGTPFATTDRHHQEFALNAEHRDPSSHTLFLHGWTGGYSPPGKRLQMFECAVVQIDPPTRELVAHTRVALQAVQILDDLEPAKTRILNALDTAFNRLELREPLGGDAFYASVPSALETLKSGLEVAGPALDAEVVAAGHAHIDVAWLWTLAQTRRKAGRTFHTALRQMEQFPDFSFTQSQPQLYAWLETDYPQLLEDIKARVADGRWEPIGGMWVEADCNISGGESLARQFLLGREYFKNAFGKGAESPVLWLPDVFGYAWNLPQLIKLAGLEYFFTIKIGWNQVNKLPYDSFYWQGLDGTKVLTHFSTSPDLPWSGQALDLMTSATYNASLTAFATLGTWAKSQHKESQKTFLMSYGYGDGGGGPTREMNENALVMRDFPALPAVKQGKVIDFFRRLESESGANLPTWNAELYLEIHRGTYTSQARNKRANRMSEFLLHDAELLAAHASVLEPGYAYPKASLEEAWKLVCLNQFHDIIPGSSINAVYKDSLEQYAQIEQLGREARDGALEIVAKHAGGDAVLVNPTAFSRSDLALWHGATLEGKTLRRADTHAPVHVQAVADGVLLDAGTVKPHAVVALEMVDAQPSSLEREFTVSSTVLENSVLRVEFDNAGDITRILDKRFDREVMPKGAIGNQWQAFEDRPVFWDAWDVDIFYDDKVHFADPATKVTVLEDGGLRATLEIKRRILGSEYTQRVSLTRGSPRLDFVTEIDWRERHVFLKAAFPVDVLAPAATFEIQWGNVQRPTHRNTSWDWARFETCAQKWVDLSEGDYGVALLNDGKYGHDIRDNVIRVSLLRAPTYPDPEADQGTQRFTYSLVPHGASTAHGIAAHAYALNDALLVRASSGATNALEPLVTTDAPNVVIETVKRAEDGGGIIVRLYECNRSRGKVVLRTGFEIASASVVNLLEEETGALEAHAREVTVQVTPFQILTVRLVPKG
jgi:alpha-mannosidase